MISSSVHSASDVIFGTEAMLLKWRIELGGSSLSQIDLLSNQMTSFPLFLV